MRLVLTKLDVFVKSLAKGGEAGCKNDKKKKSGGKGGTYFRQSRRKSETKKSKGCVSIAVQITFVISKGCVSIAVQTTFYC